MNFKSFIYNFLKRKGIEVGLSSVVEKLGGFFLVIIATRLLSKNDYGLLTYANTILVFLIPFIGFGVHQGLLRYGALANSQVEKKKLFIFTLNKGLKYSLILTVLVFVLAPILTSNLKEATIYLYILSFQFISLFLFEIIRIYARLLNLNKLYSQITNVKTFFFSIISFFIINKFWKYWLCCRAFYSSFFYFFILFKKTKTNWFFRRDTSKKFF